MEAEPTKPPNVSNQIAIQADLSHSSQPPLLLTQQSYAPFIFRGKRSQLTSKLHKLLPAPGQYQLRSMFDHHDQANTLREQFNVEIHNARKIKESAVFKSELDRFHYREQSIDHRGCSVLDPSLKNHIYRPTSLQKAKNNCSRNKDTFPSIPSQAVCYGYKEDDSCRWVKISKTKEQLSQEKQNMKKYIRDLNERGYKTMINAKVLNVGKRGFKGQNHNYSHSHGDGQYSQKRLVSMTKQKLYKNEEISANKQNNLNGDRKSVRSLNLVKSPTTVVDAEKVQRITSQKWRLQETLGPGSYDHLNYSFLAATSLNSKHKQNPKYQFFNSTQQRFKYKNSSECGSGELSTGTQYLKPVQPDSNGNGSKISEIRRALKNQNCLATTNKQNRQPTEELHIGQQQRDLVQGKQFKGKFTLKQMNSTLKKAKRAAKSISDQYNEQLVENRSQSIAITLCPWQNRQISRSDTEQQGEGQQSGSIVGLMG